MGGGDVTRYINNYGSAVAGLALGRGDADLRQIGYLPAGVWIRACSTAFATGCVKIAPSSSATSPPRSTVSMPGRPSLPALTQTLNIALLASLKGTIDCVTAFAETDFRPDMAKIDVPTLVIHGSNDQIVPFETTGKLAAG